MEQTGLKPDGTRVVVGKVAKIMKRDIIKNIDIDDLEMIAHGVLNSEVMQLIGTTVKSLEEKDGFSFSYVSKNIDYSGVIKGVPIFQTEPISYGKGKILLQLNVNVDVLCGKTIKEIDAMFETAENTVVNSLEDALIHESGHAELINGLTMSQTQDLYQYLGKMSFEGISYIAKNDGAEALSEIKVLLSHGKSVSRENLEFYKTFMGGQSK